MSERTSQGHLFIRDDLITLGIVSSGPAVRIADGAQASPVDLIICPRNDHVIEAGEALSALSAVLDRDGQQQSAAQARHQALADTDHLALLHAIWTAETTPAREKAPGEATGLGQISGLPDGSRWPCVRGQLRRRALACPGPDQGSEVRAAVRYWHYAGQYWLSQTVQAALRPSACSS
jgi:hypothetical protein